MSFGLQKEGMQQPHQRWSRVWTVLAALGALLIVGGVAAVATAGPNTIAASSALVGAGDLYFTTYSPPAVKEVSFAYQHGRLTLGSPVTVARLPGADGLLFGPNGQLLVGGQNSGKVFAVNTSGGSVTTIPAGVPGSFHLALTGDGRFLYTSGEPGPLSVVNLSPLHSGREVTLHGSDATVTALAFGPKGQALYTASGPDGRGNIGLIDLSSGTTHRLFTQVTGAHGVLYDPYSRSYLVVGGDTVLQLPASDPGRVVSELTVPGQQFDQGAVTGRGQVLVASNGGTLVLVDYSTTRRVGNVSDRVIERHLDPHLDDVAPLIGPGAPPVATSARWRRIGGGAALAAGLLLVSGLAVVWALTYLRARTPERRLPRWDRRRRAVERK